MPDIAKNVVLDMKQRKLFVDGAEFPWFVSEDGVEIHDLLAANCIPSFTVRVFADSIEVIPADG